MGTILVGTASWTDKSLVDSGKFYPAEARTPEGRLRHYATHFPLVEVDASFYAISPPEMAANWAARTPERFTFDVKAFRLFTGHQTPLKMLPKDIREALGPAAGPNVYYRELPAELADELWARFRAGLAPLQVEGKLGVVLFQFAPWFVYGRTAFAHILDCAQRLPGTQLAIEFRNKSWFDARHREPVLAFEREHALVHVVVDEPQGSAFSIPSVWEATSPEVAVLRLHGRNRATWEAKGLTSAQRFEYLYSADELAALADSVRGLAQRARRVHVLFNNCYTDYAQRNALDFMGLL